MPDAEPHDRASFLRDAAATHARRTSDDFDDEYLCIGASLYRHGRKYRSSDGEL